MPSLPGQWSCGSGFQTAWSALEQSSARENHQQSAAVDGTQSFAYDAENKIKTVNGVSDVYRYDANGNRVRKNFATGEKVRMVYNGGQLIAAYDLSNGSLKKEYVYGAKGLLATVEPGTSTRYTTTDHLGSLRIVTTSSAGVVSRHDYMPFGEELGSVGGRTAGMGFVVNDGVRQKFTQKERDSETGLDYFVARYYGSAQGRFFSTDPGPFTVVDPQNFNRYTYVQNSPLKFIDPTGTTLTLTGEAEKLVEELEAKTGYHLTRDPKTGRVTIDTGTKRNKNGTSKHLAGLLKQIIGDKEIDVNIDVGENIVHENNRGVQLDVGYDPKEFDFADYSQWNSADSKFGAIAIAHALKESYEYKKLDAAGLGGTMDIDRLSHIRAYYFESRVLSDFTGVREKARVDRSTEKISVFEYTTVRYDVLWKSTNGTEAFPSTVNRVVVRDYKNLSKTLKH